MHSALITSKQVFATVYPQNLVLYNLDKGAAANNEEHTSVLPTTCCISANHSRMLIFTCVP